MGMLVDGRWQDRGYKTDSTDGSFVRRDSAFRNWITPDGAPGPGGEGGFRAEAGRYHLYVSLACPWAHRTLIARALKGLEGIITLSVVHWHMGDQGWRFAEAPGVAPRGLDGETYLHQVYSGADARYSGRVTVPVLWDKQRRTIVSNESSEIVRMLNSAFAGLADSGPDLYPEALRGDIDAVNRRVYDDVNNGVYKAGFATKRSAYEAAYRSLFETLDWLEDRLSRQRYLAGDRISEADWRLFTTLVRFDPVYVGHFKCNRNRLVDFPNLWDYTRELYQWPGVAQTVDLHHIKQHYFGSHESINPTGIVPLGPDVDYSLPHGRARKQCRRS